MVRRTATGRIAGRGTVIVTVVKLDVVKLGLEAASTANPVQSLTLDFTLGNEALHVATSRCSGLLALPGWALRLCSNLLDGALPSRAHPRAASLNLSKNQCLTIVGRW